MCDFSPFIQQVLKLVHPDLELADDCEQIIHEILNHLSRSILIQAIALLSRGKKQKSTLDPRDIQYAIRLLLPGELNKHAVSEGTKAVVCYAERKKIEDAKLVISVKQMEKWMRSLVPGKKRISMSSAIYLTAVIEYICAEIVQLSGNNVHEYPERANIIMSADLKIAINQDEELAKLVYHKLHLLLPGTRDADPNNPITHPAVF